MKLSPKAKGIILQGENFTFIVAESKPNTDTRIKREIWFKGKAETFKKKEKNKNAP